MALRHVYGYNVRSDVEFVTPLSAFVEGAAEFQYQHSPPFDYQPATLIYTSPTSHSEFYRIGQSDLLHVPDVADFFIEESHIYWHAPSHTPMVEIFFLGPVCSLMLERRGIPTLHAAAVSVDDQVVGFLAASLSGKSTLAAHFVQAGYRLVTDDILPLDVGDEEILAVPGYPQMKLWHEQAATFHEDREQWRRLHQDFDKYAVPIDNFCNQRLPLHTLFIPQRDERSSEVKIDPLTPAAATIELIRYGFSSGVMSVSADQQRRLKNLANITRRVAVKRLMYPSGIEHLQMVRDAILQDVWAK